MSTTGTSLLDDFLSGDAGRVLHATWVTVHSREPEELDPLVAAVTRIRKAVEKVQLGGAIYSNAGNFRHALDKLDHYRRGMCWCENYPGLLQYEPNKEEAAGHVRIVFTSTPGWSMTYVVECATCGTVFDVEQGCGHVEWWQWVPRTEEQARRSAGEDGPHDQG